MPRPNQMGEVVFLNFQKPSKNVEKLRVFEKELDRGVAFIVLDATSESVLVPSKFRQDHLLGLNFSYDYGLDDFGFDERGVSATLSFDEGYFFCQVPWESVYRIGDRVWMEDIP